MQEFSCQKHGEVKSETDRNGNAFCSKCQSECLNQYLNSSTVQVATSNGTVTTLREVLGVAGQPEV